MNSDSFLSALAAQSTREYKARRLHWNTTVVLGYCNIPLSIGEHDFDPAPILGHGSLCATNLERLLLGGVKVIVWSPGIPFWKPSGEGLAGRAKVRFIQQQLEAMHRLPRLTDGLLGVARNTREIRSINAAGGVAVLLHLSGVNHLNDLGILREYYDLGVRMIHPSYQDWPDESPSSHPDGVTRRPAWDYDGGRLTESGARTIEEMKRLGIIIDVAHIRPEGFDDVVQRLDGIPFVYSHGGCHTLVQHWRNLEDHRIEQVAQHRGVYGIGVYTRPVGWDKTVSQDEHYARIHALIDERRRKRTHDIASSAPTIRDYIRRRFSQGEWNCWEERELGRLRGYPLKGHISELVAHMKYLKDRFGPDIVGYGPDYEFTYGYVVGLEEADKTPSLTRELLSDGFTEAEAQAAMGHNFMRVFDEVIR